MKYSAAEAMLLNMKQAGVSAAVLDEVSKVHGSGARAAAQVPAANASDRTNSEAPRDPKLQP